MGRNLDGQASFGRGLWLTHGRQTSTEDPYARFHRSPNEDIAKLPRHIKAIDPVKLDDAHDGASTDTARKRSR